VDIILGDLLYAELPPTSEDFVKGNSPINSAGNLRLGKTTFQASRTIWLASLNDSGGHLDNGGLFLVVSGDDI
jgi:hypothetical protein